MSMTVAIRPASLWTHATFTALSKLKKSALRRIDLPKVEFGDLRGEVRQGISISSTSHEGPWQKARHFTAPLAGGATDASSTAWGVVVNVMAVPFRAGGVFSEDGLARHINKEMFALYHVLLQFCTRYPDTLRRVHIVVAVDKESVVGASRKGRAKDSVTHGLLVKLFTLQVEFAFMLAIKWVPTAVNGNADAISRPARESVVPTDVNSIADAISRPARESVIRLKPLAFQELWGALGPFTFDLMACTESAQKVPGSHDRLPFFSQYDCEGSSGTDVRAQDVSQLPGTGERLSLIHI